MHSSTYCSLWFYKNTQRRSLKTQTVFTPSVFILGQGDTPELFWSSLQLASSPRLTHGCRQHECSIKCELLRKDVYHFYKHLQSKWPAQLNAHLQNVASLMLMIKLLRAFRKQVKSLKRVYCVTQMIKSIKQSSLREDSFRLKWNHSMGLEAILHFIHSLCSDI